ncbi:hypothetical protein ACJJI5_18845 [Microbulbifer sp. EKSA008]
MHIVSVEQAKASWQISQDFVTYTATSNCKPSILYIDKETILKSPP